MEIKRQTHQSPQHINDRMPQVKISDNDRDIETYTANGRLKQLKSSKDYPEFENLQVWTLIIPAKDSASIINKLKLVLPVDPNTLTHIKRVVPLKSLLSDENSKVQLLEMVVCSVDCVGDEDQLTSLLNEILPDDFNIKLNRHNVAKFPGFTKMQNKEWSEKGDWPLIWRGNPKAVKTVFSEKETTQALKYLHHVAEMSKKQTNGLPIASILVDPEKDEILVSNSDSRSDSNPIKHSIMELALEAAHREAENRRQQLENGSTNVERNYLCLNLHVYTTHEPCVMCSMALIHSRISRLVYIQPCRKSGAISPCSGEGYAVHWNKQLNWTYEAWEWIPHDENEQDHVINSIEPLADKISA